VNLVYSATSDERVLYVFHVHPFRSPFNDPVTCMFSKCFDPRPSAADINVMARYYDGVLAGVRGLNAYYSIRNYEELKGK
jgi:hypothetical protein